MPMKTRMVESRISSGGQFTKKYKTHEDITSYISLHWHDCFEFDVILNGSGLHICNGSEYNLKRGMISFVSPMDFHEYRECENVELINVQFKETGVSSELLNRFMMQNTHTVYIDESEFGNVEALCRLLGSMGVGEMTWEFDKNILECLIISFLRACKTPVDQNLGAGNIRHALTYLNSHFRENPSMTEVAKSFSYDPNYFCRLFRSSVGIGYKEYVRELKLNYGMRLLRFTDLPITEIAFNCGYESQAHFNREFKAFFKAPPSAFRKK